MLKTQDGAEEEIQGTENANSEESSTESNEGSDTQSQEGDNTQGDKQPPFHEHPRWKELMAKDEERTKELADLRKFREENEPVLSKIRQGNKDEEAPPSWFGGDKEAWRLYQSDLQGRLDGVRTQTIKEYESKTANERALYAAAQKHFDDSIKELETAGHKVDKNRLLKVTEQYQLVDPQGRWNYKAGAEIIKAQDFERLSKKASEDEEKDGKTKEILDVSKNEKGGEQKTRDYKTKKDFERERPW